MADERLAIDRLMDELFTLDTEFAAQRVAEECARIARAILDEDTAIELDPATSEYIAHAIEGEFRLGGKT